MSSMSVEDEIYLAIAYKGTSVSAVARAMGMARQNLYRKIRNNTLKKEELCEIGEILGGKYISCFVFRGGVILGDKLRQRKSKTVSKKKR